MAQNTPLDPTRSRDQDRNRDRGRDDERGSRRNDDPVTTPKPADPA